LKRFFDQAASAAAWVVLSPLLLAVSLAIVALDGWPVFFRQVRVGRGGRDFRLLKFRTMSPKPGAERGAFDAGDASRITRLGAFLRKTKLDELPQLWNVLSGDMSIVGPRPEVRKWVEAYPMRWEKVLRIRPGITDPASIVYRDEEAILKAADDPERHYREVVLPHKLDLYTHYADTRSFCGDLGLILRTIVAVLRPRDSGIQQRETT
jgi:lipopolysaccharide/colanic/teichoic acid biosynthesis glycosyltransferase